MLKLKNFFILVNQQRKIYLYNKINILPLGEEKNSIKYGGGLTTVFCVLIFLLPELVDTVHFKLSYTIIIVFGIVSLIPFGLSIYYNNTK